MTSEAEDTAVRMLKEGASLAQVSVASGIGITRLSALAREKRIALVRGRKPTPVDSKTRRQAVSAYKKNHSISITSQKTGLSPWVTRRVLSDAGLVSNPNQPNPSRKDS